MLKAIMFDLDDTLIWDEKVLMKRLKLLVDWLHRLMIWILNHLKRGAGKRPQAVFLL